MSPSRYFSNRFTKRTRLTYTTHKIRKNPVGGLFVHKKVSALFALDQTLPHSRQSADTLMNTRPHATLQACSVVYLQRTECSSRLSLKTPTCPAPKHLIVTNIPVSDGGTPPLPPPHPASEPKSKTLLQKCRDFRGVGPAPLILAVVRRRNSPTTPWSKAPTKKKALRASTGQGIKLTSKNSSPPCRSSRHREVD